MHSRFAPLLALVLALPFPAMAGDNSAAYSFLRADVGARAAAMAGTFVAHDADPNCLFYNPAGLATLDKPSASLGFFKHLMDINAGSLVYAHPLEDVGVLSAGVVYYNYGSFDETDDLGRVIGAFRASDLAFAAAFAGTFEENLTYGAGTRLISSQIAGYSSAAIGFDGGIFYRIPEERITLGISVRNLGTQLDKYGETAEDLPTDLSIGGSVIPRGLPLLVSLNFHKLNVEGDSFGDRLKSFSVGGEFTVSPVIQLRFGYNNEQRSELKLGTSVGLAGFSGGIGITVDQYRLDYALSSLGKVGSLHRFTLASSF